MGTMLAATKAGVSLIVAGFCLGIGFTLSKEATTYVKVKTAERSLGYRKYIMKGVC